MTLGYDLGVDFQSIIPPCVPLFCAEKTRKRDTPRAVLLIGSSPE
jgi:hypothetical protein